MGSDARSRMNGAQRRHDADRRHRPGDGHQGPHDPEQSIFAGARYLAQVREKIPERIPEPDRTWLTVAAYNVGFGHLEDARIIAQALGKNPDSWADVRQDLPLLAEERWYSHARQVRLCARLGAGAVRRPCAASSCGCSSGSLARARRRRRQLRGGCRCARRHALRSDYRRKLSGAALQPRRAAKNCSSSAPHSSISTPPNTSTRWFRPGSAKTR